MPTDRPLGRFRPSSELTVDLARGKYPLDPRNIPAIPSPSNIPRAPILSEEFRQRHAIPARPDLLRSE